MKMSFIYPINFFTDNLSVIIDVTVFYFIWTAIYSGENIFVGITYSQIITYIILARLLYHLFSWGMNQEISKIIRNGDITIELIRPLRFWCSKVFF